VLVDSTPSVLVRAFVSNGRHSCIGDTRDLASSVERGLRANAS
jgi:hypothetical protein